MGSIGGESIGLLLWMGGGGWVVDGAALLRVLLRCRWLVVRCVVRLLLRLPSPCPSPRLSCLPDCPTDRSGAQ